jgi:hypothetical protein
MPSKSQTKNKSSTKSTTVNETSPAVETAQHETVTPAVETVLAPSVVAVSETATPSLKGGKGKSKGKATTQVAATQVAATQVAAPVEVAAPTEVATSKGKNSKKSADSKKSAGVTNVVEVAAATTATVETTPKKTKGTKKAAKKQESETATEVTETATAVEGEVNSNGKQIRSFKVQLPGAENYEGRFTGLTPYQAANKALSKYYRENKQPKKQIVFSIRESTRGSKRSTYTYNGRREKLKVPVEYSIKDGRTIVKNFKNRLVKVKKADLGAPMTIEA